MVRLCKTARICEAIELAKADESFNKNDMDVDVEFVTHQQLIWLSSRLAKRDARFRLSCLVQGTSVYIPSKPAPPPKSREFLEQMERLKIQMQELEYHEMVKSETNAGTVPVSASLEVKEVKEQLSAIVNVLVSVVSVAWALWHWTGSSTSSYSLAGRTLLSLFGAFVILIAEVAVYSGYKSRVEKARIAERKKKESKTVISTFEFGAHREVSEEISEEISQETSAYSNSGTAHKRHKDGSELRKRK